jgi:hypothetical protein
MKIARGKKIAAPKNALALVKPLAQSLADAALEEASASIADAILHVSKDAKRRNRFAEIERLSKIGQSIDSAKAKRVADFPQVGRGQVNIGQNAIVMGANPVMNYEVDADDVGIYQQNVANFGGGGNDQQRLMREVMLMLNAQRTDNAVKQQADIAASETDELKGLKGLLEIEVDKGVRKILQNRVDKILKNLVERAKDGVKEKAGNAKAK